MNDGGRASRPSSREAAEESESAGRGKSKKTSREGARMQPMAQAVGRGAKQTSPSGAKEWLSRWIEILAFGWRSASALRSKPAK